MTNILDTLLEAQRLSRAVKRQKQRTENLARTARKGLTPKLTPQEDNERTFVALAGSLFRNDLDRLLTARNARLGIVWIGKRGQLFFEYTDDAGQRKLDFIMEHRVMPKMITVDFSCDLAKSLSTLLNNHKVELNLFFVKNKVMHCHLVSTDVSELHSLSLMQCRRGKKAYYMTQAEEAAIFNKDNV